MSLDQQAVIDALPAYEIGDELGRGGWGVVLAGKHRQLGRDVAIKQLPRAFAADQSIRSRFTVEAKLLASLDHPHIVPVYDFVEQDGLCLLVMELLPCGYGLELVHRATASPPAVPAPWCWPACPASRRPTAGACCTATSSPRTSCSPPRVRSRSPTSGSPRSSVGRRPWRPTPARWWARRRTSPPNRRAAASSARPPTSTRRHHALRTAVRTASLRRRGRRHGPHVQARFRAARSSCSRRPPRCPSRSRPWSCQGWPPTRRSARPSAELFGVALAEACTTAWGPGWLPSRQHTGHGRSAASWPPRAGLAARRPSRRLERDTGRRPGGSRSRNGAHGTKHTRLTRSRKPPTTPVRPDRHRAHT